MKSRHCLDEVHEDRTQQWAVTNDSYQGVRPLDGHSGTFLNHPAAADSREVEHHGLEDHVEEDKEAVLIV
jgi:hypothetical protein